MNHSPLKAIRKNCIDCSGGSAKEVRECHLTECPLYPFRFGIGLTTAKKQGKPVEAATH